MFPGKRVKWFAIFALTATALLGNADAVRADSLGWPRGCSCGDALPVAGRMLPQPNPSQTRPFWMRPTPPYSSSSVQLPLTNYQTQVVNDPLSGVAVTTYQPCNTYEPQVRRTPGCSLWQRLVNWWKSRCSCLGRRAASCETMTCETMTCETMTCETMTCQTMTCQTMTCPPTSEWVVAPREPAAAPYYTPATNGRLVPNPSSASPASPTPADRRPILDPVPRSGGEGSASRLWRPDSTVFVRTRDGSNLPLEVGPPLVAPGSQDAESEVGDDLKYARPSPDADLEDRKVAAGETSHELIPVSWSVPAPRHESKLPTDEVWDDTGWKSAR